MSEFHHCDLCRDAVQAAKRGQFIMVGGPFLVYTFVCCLFAFKK